MLSHLQKFVQAAETEAQLRVLQTPQAYAVWQGILRVVGAFGDCPRCLEVCPVGEDYVQWLSEAHREIPEKTQLKVNTAKQMQADRTAGKDLPGLSPWNIRWVGEEGYVPPKKRSGMKN
jgi:hypothetical protein